MKLSQEVKKEQDLRVQGRVIARGIQDVKVENEKNMARSAKRQQTMLERAAERALSGLN